MYSEDIDFGSNVDAHLARAYDILGPKASIQIKQSECWPGFKVDSVAKLNPIQVGPVETLGGPGRRRSK